MNDVNQSAPVTPVLEVPVVNAKPEAKPTEATAVQTEADKAGVDQR